MSIPKIILFAFVLSIIFLFPVSAQHDTSDISFPEFKLLRAQENYSFLENKASKKNTWEKLKYIPFGANSFLSVGGDVRTEFQILRNEEWLKDNHDAALFVRMMLHTDWHIGNNFRIFAQLKSGHTIGRNGPPFFLNVDRLDIHQLFAEWKFGNSRLELGRRELSYGSRRLISIREGTNVRQSFDGTRWIWKKKNHQLDLLFYAYNPQNIGVFDNRINTDQLIWGTYYVWNVPSKQSLNFDFYYLGVRNESPRFEEGTDREVRHSVGVRHWGKKGRLQYNNEVLGQVGTYGSGQIAAWTISTELNYTLPGTLALTPGLKAEIISGDKTAGDGNVQTFNALYPRGGYFGLLAVVGPANLIDIHPSLKLNPTKGLMLNLDWDFFWRHQLADGIYFPSGRLNISSEGSRERFIGHQAGIQIGRSINRFLEVEASYFYFFTGEFLRDVSRTANFAQLGTSANFKF